MSATTTTTTEDIAELLLDHVHDIGRIGGFGDVLKKDCIDLTRRISLLSHLFEEIRDFKGHSLTPSASSSSSSSSVLEALLVCLKAAKRLLLLAVNLNSKKALGEAGKEISFDFQCVTCQLERNLGSLPYDNFEVSDEVREQEMVDLISKVDGRIGNNMGRRAMHNSETSKDFLSSLKSHKVNEADAMMGDKLADKNLEEIKKPESAAIPDDFRCPISLELMRDPVIISTGQTYERSCIQRWIDCGNRTCPKTQQMLSNLSLTPNYVLRSLIMQWCEKHRIEYPIGSTNGRVRKSDGSFHEVNGDTESITSLVNKLSSHSVEERRNAAIMIRSMSKRSTDNRILIAEGGAIPVLVNLLTSEDIPTQENAVTAILNLSIYEHNKGLIMLAGAIPSLVQVLRMGSMEARENAAATLFSLSLLDENKITIGASGAVAALVELLKNGSVRGKKDAATALFNLCIYQGNKGRAVRAGILVPLMKMLTDSSISMVEEALTLLSVLASHQEGKVAIAKASAIPVLIDLLRTGLPRNKENAAAILLSLCKKDADNLSCIARLGAVIPLTELTKSGTERAKRKATSLLELLHKLQKL